MTDRELLELAAKKYGIVLEWSNDRYPGHMGTFHGRPQWHPWNPLEDDGDALCLATKLNLFVTRSCSMRMACWREKAPFDSDEPGHDSWVEVCGVWFGPGAPKIPGGEPVEKDKPSAARRAIVLAAAKNEIRKTK